MSEKKHILVVDDDVQLVDTVKTLLESAGYKVSYAYQSEKGMQLARELAPDVIILDILFAGPPGPNGLEVSQKLRQDPVLEDTPVIILTGVTKILGMRFKMKPDKTYMPVTAFVEKPFKPDRLLSEIDKALRLAA